MTHGSKQTVVGSWSQTSFISTPKISPRVHNFDYSHWNHTPGVLAYDIINIGRTVPAIPIRIELIFDHSSGCSAMSRPTTSPVFFGRMLVPPIALQYLGNSHSNYASISAANLWRCWLFPYYATYRFMQPSSGVAALTWLLTSILDNCIS